MSIADKTTKVKEELASMRTRLDELRVKGNLGKMELRDKLKEIKGTLEPTYQRAKGTIRDLASSGAEESVRLARSLESGWSELIKTHAALAKEAELEDEADQRAKRTGKS